MMDRDRYYFLTIFAWSLQLYVIDSSDRKRFEETGLVSIVRLSLLDTLRTHASMCTPQLPLSELIYSIGHIWPI